MQWSELAPQLTGYAHMATVRPDGRPHVSKVAPAVEGAVLWIGTNASSGKAHNLATIPKAALMFEPVSEIYLSADVEVVTDLATKQRLWTSGLFPYPMDAMFGSPENEDFVLLRLTPTRATVIAQGESGLRRDTWHA
jgi:general stress protein 26